MIEWRKSARCDSSACVDVSLPGWRKSDRSMDSFNCVEVGPCSCGRDVLMRDSKDPDGPVLAFGGGPWAQFLAGVRAGEFDGG